MVSCHYNTFVLKQGDSFANNGSLIFSISSLLDLLGKKPSDKHEIKNNPENRNLSMSCLSLRCKPLFFDRVEDMNLNKNLLERESKLRY